MADVVVTAANVIYSASARKETGVAGATVTAGQPIYSDSTDSGKLKLADANLSAAASNVIGIAAHGAANGQNLLYVIEDTDFTPGFTVDMTGAGADGVYVLSATAGGICPAADLAAGHFPAVLMVGKSATKVVLKITRGGTALT